MQKGKKIVQPSFLKPKDKVAFISPAYWIAPSAIRIAAEVIKGWGLEPIIGQHVDSQDSGAYAGNADERAADLLWALEQPDIKAIICARGGYGSIHLLNRIQLSNFSKYPKWFIGMGDVTCLLCAQVAGGVMAIHGPMILQIASGIDINVNLLRNMLFGNIPKYVINAHPQNIPGHAEGILIGGNLSSFSSLAGSKYYLAPKHDIILFIEEEEESLHDIDRLFYMLRIQGLSKRLKGIILGEFIDIKYELEYDSVERMIINHLHNTNIPVCCGFPVGSNSCLPMIEGAHVTLDVSTDKATLSYNIEGKQNLIHVGSSQSILIRP